MLTIKPTQPVQWTSLDQNGSVIYHRGTLAEVDGKVMYHAAGYFLLVKHSHTGKLSLINQDRLTDLPIRTD